MTRSADELRAAALAVLADARDRGRATEQLAESLAVAFERATTAAAIEAIVDRAMDADEDLGAALARATDPDPAMSGRTARTIAVACGYVEATEEERIKAQAEIVIALDDIADADGGTDGQP